MTSIGRRSYLVNYFKEALTGRGKVIAANSIADTPGMLAADEAVAVPPIADENYGNIILDLCTKYKVGLLCPFFDLDLAALAPLKKQFESLGVRAAISSPEVVNICFDKWETVKFARQNGIATPLTYATIDSALNALSQGEINYPVIVKPRWGTGSIGVTTAYDRQDLEGVFYHTQLVLKNSYLAGTIKDDAPPSSIIIQEKVSGKEFGVDVVNDLDDNYICTFAKKKIAMRSGETDAAITIDDNEMTQIAAVIGKNLQHTGLLDVDIIKTEKQAYLIEMNPRFGGHYPFAHLAGANIPAALIAWAQGSAPNPEWLQAETGIRGYKDLVPKTVN